MPLYRINYEEYLHYEEYIEAVDEDEAERIFKNTIDTLEPMEAETYTFDVTDVHKEETHEYMDDTNCKTSDGIKHKLGRAYKK